MDGTIAILVKTSPRRRSLIWLIESVKLSLDGLNYRFYIGDEQPIDNWKIKLYDEIIEEGHHVSLWDSAISYPAAKNHLLKCMRGEEYILKVDDDFELGGEFDIKKILRILELNTGVDFCSDVEMQIGSGKGMVSGCRRIRSGTINIHGNRTPSIRLIPDDKWKYQEVGGDRFAYADYVRGLVVFKRHCFDEVTWDEDIFFSGGHLDFHISLKKAGLQGAFTPDSVHLHRDDLKQKVIDMENESKWRGVGTKDGVIKSSVLIRKYGGVPRISYGPYHSLKRKMAKLLRKMFFSKRNTLTSRLFLNKIVF